jgi:hypothetical protein
MRRYQGWLFILVMALMACGCNKSEQPAQDAGTSVSQTGGQSQNASATANSAPAVKLEGPKQAVYEFLEACFAGNNEKANSLLSAIAQKKASEMDSRLTPTASDTARFTIDSLKYIGEDGANVGTTLTDSIDGSTSSDKVAWVLRKEAEAWRVVGMAVVVVADTDPVVLNFEDPADVKKKLAEISSQINGPQDAGTPDNLQAEQKDQPDDSLRR